MSKLCSELVCPSKLKLLAVTKTIAYNMVSHFCGNYKSVKFYSTGPSVDPFGIISIWRHDIQNYDTRHNTYLCGTQRDDLCIKEFE
jgi:hypothetical protein